MTIRREQRSERGAVAVLTALLLTIVLIAAAFTIDIGMQRVVRTDMQSLADVTSLDLARELDGGTAASYEASALNAALVGSLGRNQENLGDAVPSRGPCAASGDPLGGVTSGACWELVKSSGSDWARANSTDIVGGVRVFARSETDLMFGGITGADRGGSTRSAVATRADPTACVSVGTTALTLDTSGSVLSPLLTDMLGLLNVGAGVVSYQGIADLKNVSIPLLDVLVTAGIGTTGGLAGANVSLADLALAMADVAKAQDDTAAATVLKAISLNVSEVQIALSEILAVQSGGGADGLAANINALDLLGASVFAATGEHAVEADIPGLLSLTVIEPPQIACGRGGKGITAKSAQVRLSLDTDDLLFAATNAGISLPGYLVKGSAHLDVEVAPATARIDEIACGPDRIKLDVNTGAAGVRTVDPHIFLGITPARFLTVLDPLFWLLNLGVDPDSLAGKLLPGGILKLALKAALGTSVGLRTQAALAIASSHKARWIDFPPAPAVPGTIRFPEPDSQRKALSLGQTDVDIEADGGVLSLLAPVLNDVLGYVIAGVVTPLLNTVVTPLLTAVVMPLLDSLGIQLGVADVSVKDRPVCQAVRLVK